MITKTVVIVDPMSKEDKAKVTNLKTFLIFETNIT